MRKRLPWSFGLVVTAVLASASVANAAEVTLGTTTMPAGSSASSCPPGAVVAQATSDPSTPYTVPEPGTITGWRVNTTGASAGAGVTLVVLKLGAGNATVVGVDARTLPNPLPPGNVASFAADIAVDGGETLGLYTTAGGAPPCFWSGGGTPAAATLTAFLAPAPPTAGQTLPAAIGMSPPGYTMNVAATVDLELRLDAGVTATAGPANATVGGMALLASSVSNGGPRTAPITFTDTVPAGLTIVSAVAGSGTCSTSGQQVTCTISGLAPGQSAPVNIAVTPTAAGSYTNRAAVAPPARNTDPNMANNSATATLAVAAAPATGAPPPATVAQRCVVPKLKRTPRSVAKRLLRVLGCKAGKTRRARSKSVAKGAVIKTTPKAGTYAAGRKVRLIVSSGPRKKNRRS